MNCSKHFFGKPETLFSTSSQLLHSGGLRADSWSFFLERPTYRFCRYEETRNWHRNEKNLQRLESWTSVLRPSCTSKAQQRFPFMPPRPRLCPQPPFLRLSISSLSFCHKSCNYISWSSHASSSCFFKNVASPCKGEHWSVEAPLKSQSTKNLQDIKKPLLRHIIPNIFHEMLHLRQSSPPGTPTLWLISFSHLLSDGSKIGAQLSGRRTWRSVASFACLRGSHAKQKILGHWEKKR